MRSLFLTHQHGEQVHIARAVTLKSVSEKWPLWATAVSVLKSENDIGVGDTVERIIGKTNSAAFKVWHAQTFGKSCGCTERKSLWNANFPYEKR